MDQDNELIRYLDGYAKSGELAGVFGMCIWGSVARSIDLSKCNDLDVLIVFNDEQEISIETIKQVNRLANEVKNRYGIYTDPVLSRRAEVQLIIGPALAMDLAETGKSVGFGDVSRLLRDLLSRYPLKEFERRMIKRMVFWRDFVRRKYCASVSAPNNSPEYQRELAKACFFVLKDYQVLMGGRIEIDKVSLVQGFGEDMISGNDKSKLVGLLVAVNNRELYDWAGVGELVFRLVETTVQKSLGWFCNKYQLSIEDLDLVTY